MIEEDIFFRNNDDPPLCTIDEVKKHLKKRKIKFLKKDMTLRQIAYEDSKEELRHICGMCFNGFC